MILHAAKIRTSKPGSGEIVSWVKLNASIAARIYQVEAFIALNVGNMRMG